MVQGPEITLLDFGPATTGTGAGAGVVTGCSHAAIVVPVTGAGVVGTATRFPAMGSVVVVDVVEVLVLVVLVDVVEVVVDVVELVVVVEVVVVLVLVVLVLAAPRETQTLPLLARDTHIFVRGFNAYDITPEPMSDTLFEILVKRR
jgi:hypothetical protein